MRNTPGMSLFARRKTSSTPASAPVRFPGGMLRLVQGAQVSLAPWAAEGNEVEATLGPEPPPRDWPEAVAVYIGGALLGRIDGGGEPMRAALRAVAARGLHLVVPGVVESVRGEAAVRLSAPSSSDVEAWLAQGAEVVDEAAVRPVEVLSTRSDGSVVTGRRLPRAESLYAMGTPPVWGLAKRPEPSGRVASIQIGDVLAVQEDDRGWVVADDKGQLGRLTWRQGDNGKPHGMTGAVIRYPSHGRLVVSQVVVRDDRIVDFGGVVSPD